MRALADKIIQRVRGYGRGQRVFAAKDFLHLGSMVFCAALLVDFTISLV
jgi:hypothetical protein